MHDVLDIVVDLPPLVVIQAAYSFIGTEIVALTAGEAAK